MSHNRVRAYLNGKPLPAVYRSKCQAIQELHGDFKAGKRIGLRVVWKPPRNQAERN